MQISKDSETFFPMPHRGCGAKPAKIADWGNKCSSEGKFGLDIDLGKTSKKREEFAVNLRRQKKNLIIQQKRKKRAQQMSALQHGGNIEIFPYNGYRKWRTANYAEQVEVLTQLFTQFGSSMAEYSSESLDGKITKLFDIIS